MIGLDNILDMMTSLQKTQDCYRFKPHPLLRQYVDAGWTGRKSGRGFYSYQKK